ncbi:unnamed protein product [Nesidiocoris tenuis]|uniref:Uncharacterized protein n=1 Tax=Nesidiocoris tenuis TaxID=355587 RepID=A0A6H5HI77_9HEMI|nr:unnamed protein product [Nesidiocoris tenuis]
MIYKGGDANATTWILGQDEDGIANVSKKKEILSSLRCLAIIGGHCATSSPPDRKKRKINLKLKPILELELKLKLVLVYTLYSRSIGRRYESHCPDSVSMGIGHTMTTGSTHITARKYHMAKQLYTMNPAREAKDVASRSGRHRQEDASDLPIVPGLHMPVRINACPCDDVCLLCVCWTTPPTISNRLSMETAKQRELPVGLARPNTTTDRQIHDKGPSSTSKSDQSISRVNQAETDTQSAFHAQLSLTH